jgi:hypothetical protein
VNASHSRDRRARFYAPGRLAWLDARHLYENRGRGDNFPICLAPYNGSWDDTVEVPACGWYLTLGTLCPDGYFTVIVYHGNLLRVRSDWLSSVTEEAIP